MPNITDAAYIDFIDKTARPLSDYLTGLKPALETILLRWNDQIKALANASAGGDPLQDGAYGTDGTDGDGRVVLIKNDITKFFNQVQHLTDLMNGLNPDGLTGTLTVTGDDAFADLMKLHVNPVDPNIPSA